MFLYTRTRGGLQRLRANGKIALVACLAVVALGYGLVAQPAKATASPANTVNFQARLETASGSIAADGTYNVQFKLYNANSGGTALWTESYLVSASNGIRTANGYLTANLGSITAFPNTIDWGQQLYLTMNIGGTGTTASYDGEMSPRLALTSVPSAFSLNSIDGTTGFTGSLKVSSSLTGGNQTFTVPDQGVAGAYTLLTTTAANTSYIQNSTSLQSTSNFWISGNGKANTSLQAPLFDTPTATTLQIGTGTATAITLGKAGVLTTAAGGLTSSGLLTASAGLTVATGSTFTNASSTVFTPLALSLGATGNIGTNTTTVDVASAFNITATATGKDFTLPTPTASAAGGRVVYVSNVGSNSFTMYSTTLPAGTTESFVYNGSTWTVEGGATSGNYIQNTTTAQSGANFNIGANGTIGGNLSVTGTINTNTLGASALTFSGANPVISASTTNTGLSVQANGTGTLSLDTSGAGVINLGTNAATITLGSGTTAETVNLGNSSGNDSVNIATGGGTDVVNVGTNSTSATTIIQGSNNTGTSVKLQGGASSLTVSNTATAVVGAFTVSSTGSFNGLLTAAAGLTVNTGNTFTNASSTVYTAKAVTTSNGSIGTAASTVDVATTFAITETSTGQTIAPPSPTDTTAGRLIYLTNVGTNPFLVGSVTVSQHASVSLLWDGSTWTSNGVFGASNAYIANGTSQQAFANFNIDGSGQIGTTFGVGTNLTVGGTINGDTLTSTALTFSGANPTITASTTNTGLTLQANGSGALTLGSTTNALAINSTNFKVSSAGVASGLTGLTSSGTITFSGLATGVVTSTSGTLSSTPQLGVGQGGTGLPTATQYGILYGNGSSAFGVLNPGTAGYCLSTNSTGSAPTWVACSNGVTSVGTFSTSTNANGLAIAGNAITLYSASQTAPGGVNITTQTFGGDKTFAGNTVTTGSLTANGGVAVSLGLGKQLAVTPTVTPSVDLVSISNTSASFAPTADGINGQQITWFAKPGTGNLSSAQRLQVTNSNTANGGQVQALRIIAVGAGGAVNSDTDGILIDNLTNSSTGTTNENAIEIGTGWDNIIQSTNFMVTQAGGVTATTFTGSGAGLTNLNAGNINTGTLADARLSTNVALYNATNPTFSSTLYQKDPISGTTGQQVCDVGGNCSNVGTTLYNTDAYFKNGGNNVTSVGAGVAYQLGSTGAHDLTIVTNGSNRVTFDQSGNLNILSGALQANGTPVLTSARALQNVTGLTSSGAITFSGLATAGIVTNTAAGVLSTVASIPVANGGTGAATFTTNGVLYGNGTSAVTATSAGGSGQVLLANASGVPTFTTLSGDVTVSATGVTTIGSGVIDNTNLTSGSYGNITAVGTLTGLTVSGATSLTGATTINTSGTAATTIGNTTAATAVTLLGGSTGGVNVNNSGTGVTNLHTGSTGALTVGNTGAALTINSTALKVTSAGVASGLTGLTSSGTITFSGLSTNGVVTTSGGVLSSNATLAATIGGTGQSSYAVGDMLYASSTTALSRLAISATAGQCLTSTGTLPVWANCTSGSVTSIGTYSTTNTSATGATFNSGTGVLTFQDASASAPGMVGTGTQIFAGNKTFNGSISTGSTLGVTGASTLNGGVAVNLAAGKQLAVAATAVPSSDLVNITNSGFPVTAAGVSAQQIDYFANLGAGNESSALRLNYTNTSTSGTATTDGLRIAGTTNVASNSNGIRLDNITSGSGTDNAISVGTGWDNIIQSANFIVTQAGAVTAGTYNSQTISSTANFTGTVGVATSLTTPLINSTAGLTITGGSTLSLQSTGANTVSLDSGSTGQINIGTGANAKTIVLGNNTVATAVNIAGAGGLQINGTNVLSSGRVLSALTGLTSSGTITFSGLTTNGIVTTSGGVLSSSASLAVANGGTGLTAISSGQIPIGNSSGGYTAATISSGTNITVTSGSGSISVATVASPTFTGVTTATLAATTSISTPALNATASGGTITTNAGTIQRTAPGTTTLDLSDPATTVLKVVNSGAGGADLNLYDGNLTTGTTGLVRLTNAGILQNVTYNGATVGTGYGGTGLSTYTANGIFYASSTSAMGQLSGTSGQILLANASNVPTFTTISGDITVNSTGVTAISSGVIVNADLAGGSYTGITTVGSLTGLTVTGTTALNGPVTVGVAGTTTGSLKLANSGSANLLTIQSAAQTSGAVTLTIPATTFTSTEQVCLRYLDNCAGVAGTVGTFDTAGYTSAANGATIVGNFLYLQSATASVPGLVNTGAQTFGGNKIFNGTVGIGVASSAIAQLQVESSTYRSNQLLLNNGVTGTPPTYPNSYTPTLSVITSETSGSRPLFFGYKNGTAYDSFTTIGACGAFTQMCLDFGTGAAAMTALENTGTTLNVGGGDDGNFTTVSLKGAVQVAGFTTAGVVTNNATTGQLVSNPYLAVALGGTGATSLTSNGVLYGSGTSAIQATAAGTTGQCLVATTGAAPSWSTCAGSGSGSTLQAAYTNGVGGTTPEIILDSTRTSLDVQAYSGQTADLFDLRAYNASSLGAILFGVSNTGAVTAANGLTVTTGGASISGGLTVNSGASAGVSISSSTTVPSADQLSVDNTGSTGVTGAGVNGISVRYKGGAAAVESAAQRIDLQPGTTSGGTWSGLRVVQNATGPANGVTSAGAKFEGPTTGGAGTYNAINVANIGAVASGGTVRGLNITATNSNAAGTVRGIQLNNVTGGAASEIGIDLGTGWDNLVTYNNGATVIINGSGQLNVANATGTLALANTFNNGALTVSPGTGLSGGGSVALGGTTTLSLANTTVLAASYGSASSVATFTVNAQGQLTTAASTAIAIAASQITSGSVTAARGGTGLDGSAAANGSLLIGNGTGYSLATLTQGSNIAVTNASGAITVATTQNPNFTTSVTTPLLTSSGTLTVQSASGQSLALKTGTDGGTITTNAGIIQRTAAGTTILDLKDSANTNLQLFNSSTGVANLQLYGGGLYTGTTVSTSTLRLSNAGQLQNITGYSQTSGNATFMQNAADTLKIQTNTSQVPSTDMVLISNSGNPITASGINGEQIDYYTNLSNASYESGALRVNVTNTSNVATSTADGLRVVAISNKASDTNGIKIDDIVSGTGTDSALYIGTGWDSILNYNDTSIISGTGIIQNSAFSTGVGYSNIVSVGALSGGSITSGFGAITTANTITGTTLNGTTGISSGGTLRLNASGALSSISDITAAGTINLNQTGSGTTTIGSTAGGNINLTTSNTATTTLQSSSLALTATNGTLTTGVTLLPTTGLTVGANTNTNFGIASSIAMSGTINNLCLPAGSIFRLTASANFTLTGINGTTVTAGAGGATAGNSGDGSGNCGTGTIGTTLGAASGRTITLINASTSNFYIANSSASSTNGNRITTGINNQQTIRQGGAIVVAYDSVTGVWRTVGDGADAGGGTATSCTTCATTSLNNLSATAINADLLPANTGTYNLGSSSLLWSSLNASNINTAGTNNLTIGNSTAATTITLLGGATNGVNINNSGSGKTNIHTGSTGVLTIGNSGADLVVNSTKFTVTNLGALTAPASVTTPVINSAAAANLGVTAGAALTLQSTTTSSVTLDSGTTGQINIGTSANAKTIVLGNAAVATTVNIAGTGGLQIGGTSVLTSGRLLQNILGISAAGTLNLNGTSSGTATTTTIGNAGAAATAVTIVGGSTGGVTIGTSATPTTVNSILKLATLGAINTSNALCLNSSNQISTCSSSGGASFLQGGNSFAAPAVLGTNDTNNLLLETAGTTRLTISAAGKTTFNGVVNTSSAASAATLVVDNAAGSTQNILAFNVAGTTSSFIRSDSTGNMYLEGTGTGTVYLNYANGTGGIKVGNGGGTAATVSVNGSGQTVFQNSTDSSTAFQIQDTSANILFNADTSNDRLSVGTVGTATGQLYISGTIPKLLAQNSDSNLSNPTTIVSQGRYIYAADFANNKIDVYDISSGTPVFIGQNSDSNLNKPRGLDVQGHYLYVPSSANGKLMIYDISSGIPVYVSQNSDTTLGASGPVYKTVVQGKYAYVISPGSGKLVTYDISSGTPVLVGSVTTVGSANGLAVQGKYAYVAGAAKIESYDITSANPTAVASISTGGGSARELTIQGRYAYLIDNGSNLLQIYDIATGTPALVGSTTTGLASPARINVLGRFAYIINTTNGKISVYDISNASSPTYLGQNSDSTNNSGGDVIVGRYLVTSSATTSKMYTYDLGGTYTQSIEAGSSEVGQLSVNGAANFTGTVSVQGGLSIGQSLQVNGDIATNGALSVSGAIVANSGLTVSGATTLNNTFSQTVNLTGYAATIYNSNTTAGSGSGLLVKLGNRASATSHFIGFANASGTVAGSILSNGAGTAVAYNTTAADYAEYFKADPASLPTAGELVTVDVTRANGVRRAQAGDRVTGIISTDPGFVGNAPICQQSDDDCETNYAKTNVLVSLTGQVPLKTNDEGGTIHVGDPIGASSLAGVATRAMSRNIIGYALTTPDANGLIQVVINISNFDPTQDLQAGNVTASGLNLTGNAFVAGDLNVSGQTTLSNLTVNGSATFKGDLEVKGLLKVADIQVGGHIITAGNTPAITVGQALGQGDLNQASNSLPSASVDGTDTTGTITVTAGSGQLAGGVLAQISFAQAFAVNQTYKAVLSASNDHATDLRVYITKTATGFNIVSRDAPQAGMQYQFDYIVLGAQVASQTP